MTQSGKVDLLEEKGTQESESAAWASSSGGRDAGGGHPSCGSAHREMGRKRDLKKYERTEKFNEKNQ